MRQLVYSETMRQTNDPSASQRENKEPPSPLLEKIQLVRGAAFYLLEALQEVQPYINGWQGSDEGRAIAKRVNAAIEKAGGNAWKP